MFDIFTGGLASTGALARRRPGEPGTARGAGPGPGAPGPGPRARAGTRGAGPVRIDPGPVTAGSCRATEEGTVGYLADWKGLLHPPRGLGHEWRAQVTIPALAGQRCAGTRFGGDPSCTSNDFTTVVNFTQPPGGPATRIAGEFITVDLMGRITSNSPERHDGAIFVRERGNNPALNNAAQNCPLGVDRHVGSNFRIGVGHNLMSFGDNLTLPGLEHEGWCLDVTGTC